MPNECPHQKALEWIRAATSRLGGGRSFEVVAHEVRLSLREAERLISPCECGHTCTCQKALEQIQWCEEIFDDEGQSYLQCPVCEGSKGRGHTPDCFVGLALAAPCECEALRKEVEVKALAEKILEAQTKILQSERSQLRAELEQVKRELADAEAALRSFGCK